MSTETGILDIRVTNLERVVADVSEAVKSIDGSLKILAQLEVKHDSTKSGVDRAFKEIEDHEERLRAIEVNHITKAECAANKLAAEAASKDHEIRVRSVEGEMPTMKLVRNWVISGVIGVLGLVGVAAWAVVVAYQPQQHEFRSGK